MYGPLSVYDLPDWLVFLVLALLLLGLCGLVCLIRWWIVGKKHERQKQEANKVQEQMSCAYFDEAIWDNKTEAPTENPEQSRFDPLSWQSDHDMIVEPGSNPGAIPIATPRYSYGSLKQEFRPEAKHRYPHHYGVPVQVVAISPRAVQ